MIRGIMTIQKNPGGVDQYVSPCEYEIKDGILFVKVYEDDGVTMLINKAYAPGAWLNVSIERVVQ